MSKETEGPKKPFYEDIVAKKTRRSRMGKAKDGEPSARDKDRARPLAGKARPARDVPSRGAARDPMRPDIDRADRATGRASSRPAERPAARDAERRPDRRDAERRPARPIRDGFVPPPLGMPVFAPADGVAPSSRSLIDSFFDIAQGVLPLDGKKTASLPQEIRELSHGLTDERGDRRIGYMNDRATLSAYVRYFMWWNLVRLSRLFARLPLDLADGDVAVDIGSGPLTVPIALWIARPELRARKITWYCVDISSSALAAGEELFLSVVARTGVEPGSGDRPDPWQIVRVKGECGVSIRKRASLVVAANVFNELFMDNPEPIEALAKRQAADLSSYAADGAGVLVVEPGVPRAGRFVSLIRDSLARLGFVPRSPCPHAGACPFPGLRHGKWCHFVLDATEAPVRLRKLSEEAGLPKDRAALSFVYSTRVASGGPIESAGEAADDIDAEIASRPEVASSALERVAKLAAGASALEVRVVSDPIRLPERRSGRYGCSEIGMVLLTGDYGAASFLDGLASGDLVRVTAPSPKRIERDQKTGAILIPLGRPHRREDRS